MPRVERAQRAHGTPRRCARSVAPAPGRAAPARRGSRSHGRLHVARVVPPVRVDARASARRLAGDRVRRDARRRRRPPACPPPCSTTSPIHASSPSPLSNTTVASARPRRRFGPRLVLVRVGVRAQDLRHVDGVAADGAHEVAELRRGGDDRDPVPPLARPPSRSRRRAAPAAGAARRGGGRRARRRPARSARDAAASAKTSPASTAIAAPGRRVESRPTATGRRRPRPRRAPRSRSATSAAASPQPRRRGRDDEQRGGQQRADGRQRGDGDERDEASSSASGTGRAHAERARRGGVEAGRQPARPERQRVAGEHDGTRARPRTRRRRGRPASRLPNSSVSTLAAGVEDVGREDHAGRQRADEHERGRAVVALAVAPRQPADEPATTSAGRARPEVAPRTRGRRPARARGRPRCPTAWA